jgi:hypothetical protein
MASFHPICCRCSLPRPQAAQAAGPKPQAVRAEMRQRCGVRPAAPPTTRPLLRKAALPCSPPRPQAPWAEKDQRRGARPATPPAIRRRNHLGWAMVGPPIRGPSAPCLLLNCRRQHWELYTVVTSSSAIALAALVTREDPAPSTTAHCGARLPCTGSSVYKGARLLGSLAARKFGLGLGGQDAQASSGPGGPRRPSKPTGGPEKGAEHSSGSRSTGAVVTTIVATLVIIVVCNGKSSHGRRSSVYKSPSSQ